MSEIVDIGVDTEATVPDTDYEPVARREFSSGNMDWIESAPKPERLRRFYRIWAVREALAKAHGLGLAAPPSALELEIFDGAPQPRARNEWRAHEAPAEPDYVTAAVVMSSVGVRWHMTSWDALGSLTN
jgi:4'-phosphopantetheinyl transferase